MSRTDKDEPWWVDPVAYEPEHYRCQYAGRWPYWLPYSQRHTGERVCDLPPAPRRGRYGGLSRWRHPELWARCVWAPVDDRRYGDGSVPGDYIMAHWTGPDRARVRDGCRRAVVEHRATGEVDVIPPGEQHRHRAGWSYW